MNKKYKIIDSTGRVTELEESEIVDEILKLSKEIDKIDNEEFYSRKNNG